MSENRYITIPSHRSITVEGKQLLAMFMSFFEERTADERAFGACLDDVLTAADLRALFRSTKPGDVVAVTLAQWEKLCVSTRTPARGYQPTVMMQCLPFAQAILDAPSTDPRPTVEAEAQKLA